MNARPRVLDETDLKIIRILLADGRKSIKDIAAAVNLSPTPCLRRVSLLENDGYITRYKAVVDPARLGYSIRAYLSIKRQRDGDLNKLTDSLMKIPQVLACHIVSGDSDLIAEVVAHDMAHYADVILDKISKIEGVFDLRSTFAIRTIRTDGALPV